MSARTEVVDLLTAHLPPDVEVIPYSRNIAAPEHSVVMVRADRVDNKPPAAGIELWEMTLVLIGARTTAGPADDEADALLRDVLFALRKQDVRNGVVWSAPAVRATYGEPDPTNPAYEVPITVAITIEE